MSTTQPTPLAEYDRVAFDFCDERLEGTIVETVPEPTVSDVGATVVRVLTDAGVYRADLADVNRLE